MYVYLQVYVSEPSNPSKVKVYGPGVSAGVKTMAKTYFVVDCKTAGPGRVCASCWSTLPALCAPPTLFPRSQ